MIKNQKVAILDAGSQYGKLIDRRIRELHCYSELLPLETKADELREYSSIIISGGPSSFNDENAPQCDPEILNLNIPILGICYGMQWLNVIYGSKVEKSEIREDGQLEITVDANTPLFLGMEERQLVLLTHGDSVTNLANELIEIGRSSHFISAVKHKEKEIYGVQFHPEVDLTVNGNKILKNFLFRICKLEGNYKMINREEKAIREIKETVGDKHVVCLLSGGVDSTVCCALLYKALGKEKVHAIYVNTGFMRMNEDKLVSEALHYIGFKLDILEATEIFLNSSDKSCPDTPLRLVVNPELKRKIIGDTFIKVISAEIEKLGYKHYFLAQGTLRPDLIESASSLVSSKAQVIKTHHNDTELVREKRKEGLIIEPLKDYHKDEVRILGKILNLPDNLVYRQPFPGPGLAIRILCHDKEVYDREELASVEKNLKEKFEDEENKINLLPIKSVGVQGDGRSYSFVAAISGKKDWFKLIKITKDITKSFHTINRVVYVFGEVNNISTTKTYLQHEEINQLKICDHNINKLLLSYNNGIYLKTISQMPIVLIPISFENEGDRSIVIRPFITRDFMTGIPAIPGIDIDESLIDEMNKSVLQVKGISRLLIDLTSKPPGTTEWE